MAGWVKKAENKAKAQQSWGLGFAELGKIGFMLIGWVIQIGILMIKF